MKRQRPQGGRIVNNGSISAHAPRPWQSAPTPRPSTRSPGVTKSLALDGRAYDIACGQIDIGNAGTQHDRSVCRRACARPMGDFAVEPTDRSGRGRRGDRLHGEPAAVDERAVDDADGDQDAVRRAGLSAGTRLETRLASASDGRAYRRRRGIERLQGSGSVPRARSRSNSFRPTARCRWGGRARSSRARALAERQPGVGPERNQDDVGAPPASAARWRSGRESGKQRRRLAVGDQEPFQVRGFRVGVVAGNKEVVLLVGQRRAG